MLPKISFPTFTIEIPSTKKKEMFRPFLVKEEKILLMAKLSEKDEDILTAIKQIVNNCAIDETFDVDNLSIFDLEYLFIKIRAASVEDIVKVSYKDNEDNKIYDFEVNLNNIKIIFPDKIENNIKIGDDTGIIMKYPNASIYDDKEFLNSGNDALFNLIIKCIDKIYDGEEMYDVKSYKKEDVENFLESLDVKTFEKIKNFMTNQPKMSYDIKYTNANGKERTINLSSLSDFFTLRWVIIRFKTIILWYFH